MNDLRHMWSFPAPARLGGMWRGGIIRRRAASRPRHTLRAARRPAPRRWDWVLLGIGVGCLIACSALAQAADSAAPAAAEPAPAAPADAPDSSSGQPAPRVDWSHALRAQRRIEAWLKKGAVPDKAAKSIEVTGLTAVHVTLRRDGRALGRGQAVREDLPRLAAAREAAGGDQSASPAPSVDLMALVRTAAAQAVRKLRGTLRDARMRSAVDPDIRKPGKLPRVQDIAGRIQVDIQLAGPLHPIHVNRGDPRGAVVHHFAPGYHGLRLANPSFHDSQGPRVGSLMWPASALAANTSPTSQIIQLLHARGDPPTELKRVARPGGPRLQRFKVIHVTRPQLDMEPTRLVRGNLVVSVKAMNRATLNAMASGLAGHLRRAFLDDGRVRGTYQPSQDTYQPTFASPAERALACYALTRHARLLLDQHPSSAAGQSLARLTLRSAGDLGKTLLHGDQAGASDSAPTLDTPSAGALVLLTLVDSPAPGADHTLRDRLAHAMEAMHQPGRGYETAAAPGAGKSGGAGGPPASAGHGRLSQPTAALVTAALAAYHQRTGEAKAGKVARDAMGTIWTRAHKDPNIAALPWFLLARQRLAPGSAPGPPPGSTDPSPDSSEASDAAAGQKGGRPAPAHSRNDAINRLIAHLLTRQVIEAPAIGPKDVVGGFELRSLPPGAPPNPDWRTAQLLDFLALAIRDPQLTPPTHRIGRLLSAGLAVRFLGQLMMSRASCYYVPNVPGALHGVRLSLWDNREAVGPNAATLLALTDLQQTLDTLHKKQRDHPTASPANPP